MTQSFIQPKGTLKPQIDVSNLMQNWANNIAQEQVQGKEAKPDPIRETVNELVKSNLLNKIEIPKPYTTIQDVFNANNGDRFKALGEWFNSPQFNRMIGGDFTYNPVTKRMESNGERIGREQEARLNADREKALEQQKQQLALANNVYDAYNRMDIANEANQLRRDLAEQELAWRKEENALDRALKRESLNAQIAHQRAMEGIARERVATGKKQEKELQKNIDALKSLNAIQDQMDRFSGTFKKVRGSKAGALLANTYASHGFGNEAESNFNAQRTLLFNKIARELGGEKGVLSDQDIKRIETSLPALSDSYAQKKAKMQAVYNLLDDRKSQYGGAVSAGMASQMSGDPLGLGF